MPNPEKLRGLRGDAESFSRASLVVFPLDEGASLALDDAVDCVACGEEAISGGYPPFSSSGPALFAVE
jgi:hypothetical protein